jgi:hypothetical protein
VEAAMRADPLIEGRVAAHRTLRQRLQDAYSAELSQEVPERLLAAARLGPSRVVSLDDARAERARKAVRPALPGAQWRTTGSLAASLILGLGLGFFFWGRSNAPLTRGAGGALVAEGALATALSNQLAAEQPANSAIKIGLSFRAKSGEYCRTFALSGSASPSGLACLDGKEWQIQALAQGGPVPGSAESGYRTAGSAMPASILKSVEERIAGEPLDQSAEITARRRGWKAAN